MKILILGSCGFVGSSLARRFREQREGIQLFGMDNFSRDGSRRNLETMKDLGVEFFEGDIRNLSDFEKIPPVDWVVDAAANPSVLAGVDGRSSGLSLFENNLFGSVHALEYCRQHNTGMIFLSTSRVYSINALRSLPFQVVGSQTMVGPLEELPTGIGLGGIQEEFSTEPPLSLYGASKRATETVALEYGEAFDFPVWVDRCGILAGAGQFGRADQGIVSFWIQSWLEGSPLKYIGFGGKGYQTRDVLHPLDLADLLLLQMDRGASPGRKVFNVAGGIDAAFSLRELSDWCAQRLGKKVVGHCDDERAFDLPWVVLDDARVREEFGWKPSFGRLDIFEEVAAFSEAHPGWPALPKTDGRTR